MQNGRLAEFDVPGHPLAKKIFLLQKNTENDLRELRQKLGDPKETEAFLAKVADLEAIEIKKRKFRFCPGGTAR